MAIRRARRVAEIHEDHRPGPPRHLRRMRTEVLIEIEILRDETEARFFPLLASVGAGRLALPCFLGVRLPISFSGIGARHRFVSTHWCRRAEEGEVDSQELRGVKGGPRVTLRHLIE